MRASTRSALGIVGAILIAGAVAVWGCATTTEAPRDPGAPRGERPNEKTPDGGWANYQPGTRTYEPDPGRAAAGTPTRSPTTTPTSTSRQ